MVCKFFGKVAARCRRLARRPRLVEPGRGRLALAWFQRRRFGRQLGGMAALGGWGGSSGGYGGGSELRWLSAAARRLAAAGAAIGGCTSIVVVAAGARPAAAGAGAPAATAVAAARRRSWRRFVRRLGRFFGRRQQRRRQLLLCSRRRDRSFDHRPDAAGRPRSLRPLPCRAASHPLHSGPETPILADRRPAGCERSRRCEDLCQRPGDDQHRQAPAVRRRVLATGFNYTYEVRAEVVRDGRTVEQVKKIDLRAGETANLAFDFPATLGGNVADGARAGRRQGLSGRQRDKG